jgi:hypothetical protein
MEEVQVLVVQLRDTRGLIAQLGLVDGNVLLDYLSEFV